MSTPVLESALVQILFRGENGEHRPVGAGFLVTARHIFTCAHVVNNSLGLRPVCAEQPIIPVWLDFPLLRRSSHAPLKATVKVWHPMHSSPQRDKFEDIAVLELMEEVVLPREAGSVPLVKVDRFFDRPVRMVGFPGKKDEVDWLSGTLQSHVENGRVQIDTGVHSRSVRPGFSGAPVWESGEDAVAGMIVAADTGTGILSAYMIPTAILRDACPDLSLPAREPCERAPEPFLHLRDRFTDTLYFPSWEDLQQGRFYFHSDYHQPLEQYLAEQRHGLIVGRSGSGKTALAYSLGFRFAREDPIRRVFYTDTAPRSPSAWLDAMRAHDRPEYLFIIDNAHDFPDACNELLHSFGAVRHARLLLLSQPLSKHLAGPDDESYLGRLRRQKVELQVDTVQLEGVLHVFVQLAACMQESAPRIGDKQKLLRKCEGNLHLLKYHVMAWEQQPQRALSDINEGEVLENFYARYLAGKPYADALARLGTLGQFDIPADRKFFSDPIALEQDPLVEQRESLWGDLQLSLYHATPARYLALTHVYHTQGRRQLRAWTLGVLHDYLCSQPSNFFAVFNHLHRNGKLDLKHSLFAALPLEELFQAQLDNAQQVEDLNIVSATQTFKGVWSWEKGAAGTVTQQLLERLDRWLAREGYAALRQLNVREVCGLLFQWYAPATLRRWQENLDYHGLGERSRAAGVPVKLFMKLAKRAGANKTALQAFVNMLDFKVLGTECGAWQLNWLNEVFELASHSGKGRAALWAFAEGLDFHALEEMQPQIRLVKESNFLQLAVSAGIDTAEFQAFAATLGFKPLDQQPREEGEVGLNKVMDILLKARQADIDQGELRLFCARLDWHKLGQSVVKDPDQTRNMFCLFQFLLREREIAQSMTLQFIDGIGWDTLRRWVQEVFNFNVLAACRDVLKVKCRCESQTLRQRGIDLDDPGLWWRALLRPLSELDEGLKYLRAPYFKEALRLIEQGGIDALWGRARTLRDLSIVIDNLQEIYPGSVAQEVEPRLQAWDAARWQNLFDQADVRNLSTFLCRFSPRDGLFQWSLPVGLRFPLDGKIRQATLEELAHVLFNFFFIRRPEESHGLALRLEAENGYILEQLEEATLQEIEFFFWNYWLALPPEHEARLFHLPGLPDGLLPKLGTKKKNWMHWLGLAGSWRMAGAAGLYTIQKRLHRDQALGHCRKLAARKSPVLIRSLIGLSLLGPILVEADRRLFVEALRSTVLPGLKIPNQDEAMVYLEAWLKTR